ATVDNQMITRAAEPNIVTALAAKSPNVHTTQTSGDAGAGTAIRIRGVTGFGGGQPQIIVDGMPINNTSRVTGPSVLQGGPATNRAFDINPEDIESIEILKGPAATSIFGASAGAGGAILITTRRGQAGQTRFSLRSTAQFDRAANYVPLQQRFGSGTLTDGVPASTPCLRYLVDGSAPVAGCTHNNPTWGPALPAGVQTYDHARELFETGTMFDNTLSISGGSEQTRFFLSAGMLNHNGFIAGDNDQFKRYTVRLNADHQARSNLRVGGNIAYAQTDGRFVGRGNSVNGLLLGALRTPPEFDNTRYLDDTYGLHRSYRFPNPRIQDLINGNRGFDNPFFVINEHPNLGEVGRVYGNINWNWTPLPWLSVNHTLGADYASDDRTEAFHVSSSGAASGGTLSRWQFYDRLLDHNLLATASFMVRPGISGSFSAGQNLNERYFRQIEVNAQRFVAPFPYKLTNTVDRSPPTDAESKRRLEGYFAQAELDVSDQLFLTARIRNDGASTFGTSQQRAWYPGGQAAWTFTRAFNPLPDNILTLGKVRIAYGQSGQEPGVYQLQTTMSAGAISDFNPGSSIVPTLNGFGGLWTSTVMGNPDLKPERVAELDMGIDLVMLNGRMDLALTHYRQDSEDVIFSVGVPPSTGTGSVTLNAGELQNRGWETVLNVRPIQTPTVGLNIGVNWARNRNMVKSLGEITAGVPRTVTGYSTSFTGSTTHAQVGEPLGIFRGFGYVRCGISPSTINITTGGQTYNVGDVCAGQPNGALFLNAAGLPVSDPNERIIGDPNPDWTAGLNAELSIRGVRLSAFVDHRQGGQTFNMTRGSLQSLGVHAFTDVRDQTGRFEQLYPWGHDGVVVGPGAGMDIQIGQAFFGNLGGLGAREHLMEDATHTRLREVSVAYTFTQPWVSRMVGMSSIDVRLSGRNLHTWTDYSGFDPEVHTGGAAVANRGIDWFQNPLSRAWVLSVGLNR
ncbi:MAG TPA: SusC/RagA family TonB-linked outer membrane protein, partial [Longimicrobiales bacterium]|nr:SusC/RagA family TonB-linked outer membrane protein [Longimicrobiales bacterium]